MANAMLTIQYVRPIVRFNHLQLKVQTNEAIVTRTR